MRSVAASAKFLKKLRALNCVNRWNYHPRIQPENVSQHSFWVALISMELGRLKELDDAEMGQLLSASLVHDMAEAITGDIPAPVKRDKNWSIVEHEADMELEGDMPDITVEVKALVKLADIISAALFAKMEVDMGNTMFMQIRDELFSKAHSLASEQERVNTLFYTFLIELGINWIDIQNHPEMSHL